jgi:hypothetical protein
MLIGRYRQSKKSGHVPSSRIPFGRAALGLLSKAAAGLAGQGGAANELSPPSHMTFVARSSDYFALPVQPEAAW